MGLHGIIGGSSISGIMGAGTALHAQSGVTQTNTGNDHNVAINRDMPNQHPVSAITGLQEELNQIDEEKMPHISRGEPTVLVNTTTVSFSKDGDHNWYISPDNPLSGMSGASFGYDKIYRITWDGVVYEEFAVYYQRLVYWTAEAVASAGASTLYIGRPRGARDLIGIGNVTPIGYVTRYDSSAPFCITYNYTDSTTDETTNGKIHIISYNSSATHTIKIETISFTKEVFEPQVYEKNYRGTANVWPGTGLASIIGPVAKEASGSYSISEGRGTVASGLFAHAEGAFSVATGDYGSHAEGGSGSALGSGSHAEGNAALASGEYSHAEGVITTASGSYSHAEGRGTIANHRSQHSSGEFNIEDTSEKANTSRGTYAEIVGNGKNNEQRSNARTLDWSGNEELAGDLTLNKGGENEVVVGPELSAKIPHVSYGEPTVLVDTTTVSFSKDGDYSWYISPNNPLNGVTENDMDYNTLYRITWDDTVYDELCVNYYRATFYTEQDVLNHIDNAYDFTVGRPRGHITFKGIGNVTPLGYVTRYYSNAPFAITYNYSDGVQHVASHVMNIISYDTESSHTVKIEAIPITKSIENPQLYLQTTEGSPNQWSDTYKCSILGPGAKATGSTYSYAAGAATIANGYCSFAEGSGSVASGHYGAHAEGAGSTASGLGAHSEGGITLASGSTSHAEGTYSTASGLSSHAEGRGTIANHESQHAGGEWNIADPSNAAATERGNYIEIIGNGTDYDARSNARTLDWSGNEALSGDLTINKGGANETSVGTALANKVNRNFGSNNAGKILVVGSDGNVVAVTMSDWQNGNY